MKLLNWIQKIDGPSNGAKSCALSLSLGVTFALALAPTNDLLAQDNAPVESDYYTIETFAIPEGTPMEIGAMTTLCNGDLMVGTRTGDIFIIKGAYGDPEKVEFHLWARGIAQPLGLIELDGWIYTAQRGELTRMKDSNDDGRADIFETVCDDWEISGNYHEYNFGPRLDPEGYLWVTLNKPFGGEPYGRAHWRGWAVRIDPKTGEMFPMSAGLRSPAGLEISPWGDVFYTDNQGEWCNASKMSQLEFGDYHGHPHGLPTKELAGKPFSDIPNPESGTFMKDLHETIPSFKMPTLWFPYDKMGKSPSGFKWDTSGGDFGPFSEQVFVADQHHAWIMRGNLEKVNGHWQGASYQFLEGFQCGIIRVCFGKDQSLFVGMSNAGWGGRGNAPWGIQRVRWNGKTPFEIHETTVQPDGFKLTFTHPVDVASAGNPESYSIQSYTYRLRSNYGGPEEDVENLSITSIEVAEDLKSAYLKVSGLREGYVHEIHSKGVRSGEGLPILHPIAYYTLVELPE